MLRITVGCSKQPALQGRGDRVAAGGVLDAAQAAGAAGLPVGGAAVLGAGVAGGSRKHTRPVSFDGQLQTHSSISFRLDCRHAHLYCLGPPPLRSMLDIRRQAPADSRQHLIYSIEIGPALAVQHLSWRLVTLVDWPATQMPELSDSQPFTVPALRFAFRPTSSSTLLGQQTPNCSDWSP